MNVPEFRPTNKETAVMCIIGVIVLVAVYCVLSRTEPVYNDTNRTLAECEERINAVESRLDSLSKRLADAEKTVQSVSQRVDTSAGLAKEINAGIGTVETRLDDAIQRSGRLANELADIEREHK